LAIVVFFILQILFEDPHTFFSILHWLWTS
jgi:hypothetical protein